MPFNLSQCVQIGYEFRSVAFEEKEKLVYLARRKTFRNKKKKLDPQRNAGPNQTWVPLLGYARRSAFTSPSSLLHNSRCDHNGDDDSKATGASKASL